MPCEALDQYLFFELNASIRGLLSPTSLSENPHVQCQASCRNQPAGAKAARPLLISRQSDVWTRTFDLARLRGVHRVLSRHYSIETGWHRAIWQGNQTEKTATLVRGRPIKSRVGLFSASPFAGPIALLLSPVDYRIVF